jgi:hypothetical protein
MKKPLLQGRDYSFAFRISYGSIDEEQPLYPQSATSRAANIVNRACTVAIM